MKKHKGNIKWFDNKKGYGFINYHDMEIFVHITQVNDNTLTDGEMVEFEIVKSTNGYRAKNVTTFKV